MRVAALVGSDVPMAYHFTLRFDCPDCLLDLAHWLLGIPVSFRLLLREKLGCLFVKSGSSLRCIMVFMICYNVALIVFQKNLSLGMGYLGISFLTNFDAIARCMVRRGLFS